jgi:hypothetical protein
MNNTDMTRISRREVLQWIAASVAISDVSFLSESSFAKTSEIKGGAPNSVGYGTDPRVNGIYNPGDFWPLILQGTQLKTVTLLADLFFPEDHLGPAASVLQVPAYINEWVSAPYPQQLHDREIVLEGLRWLENEAQTRFRKSFNELANQDAIGILNDIRPLVSATTENKIGMRFFLCFRNIATGAYYRTQEGWKALGYVGNTPTQSFDGPPQEVLDRLGLAQLNF